MANKSNGWIKLHRKILDNPISDNPHWVWFWIFLLLKANHQDNTFIYKGQKRICKRGQLLTGRKKLSLDSKISESTVERALNYLESEQQIEQQKFSKYRLITILNYNQYQEANNKRTANEQQEIQQEIQQADTNKNIKNIKNVKNNIPKGILSPHPKELLNYFGDVYKKKTEMSYTASFAKDTQLLKSLLSQHTKDEIMLLINQFFVSTDSFVVGASYTVGVFYSVINKLKVELSKNKKDEQIEQQKLELKRKKVEGW